MLLVFAAGLHRAGLLPLSTQLLQISQVVLHVRAQSCLFGQYNALSIVIVIITITIIIVVVVIIISSSSSSIFIIIFIIAAAATTVATLLLCYGIV